MIAKNRQMFANKADRHKSRAPSLQRRTDRQTDRQTNRQTDRLNDRATYRVACTRLKIGFFSDKFSISLSQRFLQLCSLFISKSKAHARFFHVISSVFTPLFPPQSPRPEAFNNALFQRDGSKSSFLTLMTEAIGSFCRHLK